MLRGAGNDGDRLGLRRLSLWRLCRWRSAAPKQLLENIAEAREIGLSRGEVVVRYAGHFSCSAFAFGTSGAMGVYYQKSEGFLSAINLWVLARAQNF